MIGDLYRVVAGGSNDSINSRAVAQAALGLQRTWKAGGQLLAGEDPLAAAYAAMSNLGRAAATFAGVPLDAPLALAEGAGKALMGRPEEFHLQQEATRLRAQGGPKGIKLVARDRMRLRRLEGTLGRVSQIRKMVEAGKLPAGRGQEIVTQLLKTASGQ